MGDHSKKGSLMYRTAMGDKLVKEKLTEILIKDTIIKAGKDLNKQSGDSKAGMRWALTSIGVRDSDTAPTMLKKITKQDPSKRTPLEVLLARRLKGETDYAKICDIVGRYFQALRKEDIIKLSDVLDVEKEALILILLHMNRKGGRRASRLDEKGMEIMKGRQSQENRDLYVYLSGFPVNAIKFASYVTGADIIEELAYYIHPSIAKPMKWAAWYALWVSKGSILALVGTAISVGLKLLTSAIFAFLPAWAPAAFGVVGATALIYFVMKKGTPSAAEDAYMNTNAYLKGLGNKFWSILKGVFVGTIKIVPFLVQEFREWLEDLDYPMSDKLISGLSFLGLLPETSRTASRRMSRVAILKFFEEMEEREFLKKKRWERFPSVTHHYQGGLFGVQEGPLLDLFDIGFRETATAVSWNGDQYLVKIDHFRDDSVEDPSMSMFLTLTVTGATESIPVAMLKKFLSHHERKVRFKPVREIIG